MDQNISLLMFLAIQVGFSNLVCYRFLKKRLGFA